MYRSQNQILQIINVDEMTQDSEKNKSSSRSGTGQSGTYVMDQEKSIVDALSPCSTTAISGKQECRQFWKARTYDVELAPVFKTQARDMYHGYSILLKKLMEFSEGKIIMALEGGYDLESLANSVLVCVEVLLEGKPMAELLMFIRLNPSKE
ncbi:histone deacetylase 5 [Tanacetum coccineum]